MQQELVSRRGADRRGRRVSRFLERRGAFDRRGRYPILGTLRDEPRTLILLLVLVNVLSLADGSLTGVELFTGVAREGNPILGSVIASSPLWAAFFKVAVILVVSFGIWRWRRYRAVLALAPVAMTTYVWVIAYHVGSLRGLGLL